METRRTLVLSVRLGCVLQCELLVLIIGRDISWEKLGGRRFLLPHYTSPWTFVMAVAACIYQGFIWASIRGASNSPIPMDGILWRTLTWLAPYLGLYVDFTAFFGGLPSLTSVFFKVVSNLVASLYPCHFSRCACLFCQTFHQRH